MIAHEELCFKRVELLQEIIDLARDYYIHLLILDKFSITYRIYLYECISYEFYLWKNS